MTDPSRIADRSAASPAWRVHQVRTGDDVRITDVERLDVPAETLTQDAVTLRSLPRYLREEGKPSAERYEEVLYASRALPEEARALAEASAATPRATWPGSEVRTLSGSGQTKNRINLTIVGDGYTADQKDRFFADATRIKDELFAETTFRSYQPLFNVHAVFVPSKESGLSDGSNRKDTALGLYREPAGSKRAIMPGSHRAIDRAIDLAPATDYPILLANDDFYGGLGGQYAITTRSEASGAMVLRHELGHNFGNVGEEYDGGSVYQGANHSSSTDVPWKAWVEGDTRAYGGKALVGAYPWHNLKEGPLTFEFDVPAQSGTSLRIGGSFVGWETPDDVHFLLDGKPIDVEVAPTNDRGFFAVGNASSIPPGHHHLEVAENIHDGDNVLANIRVTAYDPGYDFTPDKVEAFPSFNDDGDHVGYRPTHESCLMRDMTSKEFCAIDKENMWRQFLKRVSLIDGVTVGATPPGSGASREVSLLTPPLEGLDIKWTRVDSKGAETPVPELDGRRAWTPADTDHGHYRVHVAFSTPEVRRYDGNFHDRIDVSL